MTEFQEITPNDRLAPVFRVLRVEPPASVARLPLDDSSSSSFRAMEEAADKVAAETLGLLRFRLLAAAARLRESRRGP